VRCNRLQSSLLHRLEASHTRPSSYMGQQIRSGSIDWRRGSSILTVKKPIDAEPVRSPCGWQIQRARRFSSCRGWPDTSDHPEPCWQRQRSIGNEDMGIYEVCEPKKDAPTSGSHCTGTNGCAMHSCWGRARVTNGMRRKLVIPGKVSSFPCQSG
jgi:hypothetical protein